MHELSIANNVVEIATEYANTASAEKVSAITLRIGALSCVHKTALEFSFELVAKDTLLEGATLNMIQIPVTIFCKPCGQEVQLPGIQSFRCPICHTPSAEIRQGRELEIDSIEIVENRNWKQSANPDPATVK
jgi:hydrogenase nickel incorporation protein HypA/HybF